MILAAMAIAMFSASAAAPEDPRYTADGQLVLPSGYREWVYLTSGLGMTYGAPQESADPAFDNVFVNRAAYDGFLKTGTWPDQTVMVLEIRSSQSKGSINRAGHFQSAVRAVEVHVKDQKRFPSKWGFFGFAPGKNTASLIPSTERCYSCHEKEGAVDTTFVQFYPTLIETAKTKGTWHLPSEPRP